MRLIPILSLFSLTACAGVWPTGTNEEEEPRRRRRILREDSEPLPPKPVLREEPVVEEEPEPLAEERREMVHTEHAHVDALERALEAANARNRELAAELEAERAARKALEAKLAGAANPNRDLESIMEKLKALEAALAKIAGSHRVTESIMDKLKALEIVGSHRVTESIKDELKAHGACGVCKCPKACKAKGAGEACGKCPRESKGVSDKAPGFLGVGLSEVEQGLEITFVEPGSPAEAVGLRKGDILLTVNGKRLKTSKEVRELFSFLGAGAKVDIVILRDGKEIVRIAELGTRPEESSKPAEEPRTGGG